MIKMELETAKNCKNVYFLIIAINEQILNIAQNKDTLCRMMYN